MKRFFSTKQTPNLFLHRFGSIRFLLWIGLRIRRRRRRFAMNLLRDRLDRILRLFRHCNMDPPNKNLKFSVIYGARKRDTDTEAIDEKRGSKRKASEGYLNRGCGSEPQVWSLRTWCFGWNGNEKSELTVLSLGGSRSHVVKWELGGFAFIRGDNEGRWWMGCL